MCKAIPTFASTDEIFDRYGAFRAEMVAGGSEVMITIIGDDVIHLQREDGSFEPLHRDEVLAQREGTGDVRVYPPSLYGSHFRMSREQ